MLSRTEQRIISLLYEGKSYKEIENNLPMNINTLKTHVRRIVEKTRARNPRNAIYIWRESQARQLQLAV